MTKNGTSGAETKSEDAKLAPGDAKLAPGDAKLAPGDAKLAPEDAKLAPELEDGKRFAKGGAEGENAGLPDGAMRFSPRLHGMI